MRPEICFKFLYIDVTSLEKSFLSSILHVLLRSLKFFRSRFYFSSLMINSEAGSHTALWVLHLVLNIVLESFLVMVQHDLVVQQVFELLCCEFVIFKVEIVGIELVSYWLVFGVVELLQKGMFESLGNCDAFRRINDKHFLQQVYRNWIVVCEKLIHGLNF